MLALIAALLIQIAGLVWQRELGLQFLRAAVRTVAVGGSPSIASAEFAKAVALQGLDFQDCKWSQSAIVNGGVIEATCFLKSKSLLLVGQLPITLHVQQVKE